MTIHLASKRRAFAQADFASLKLHYDEQVRQIHVMAEYVQRGLSSMASALRLTMGLFRATRRRLFCAVGYLNATRKSPGKLLPSRGDA